MRVIISVYKGSELIEQASVNGIKASERVENKYRSQMTINRWVQEGWRVCRNYPNK